MNEHMEQGARILAEGREEEALLQKVRREALTGNLDAVQAWALLRIAATLESATQHAEHHTEALDAIVEAIRADKSDLAEGTVGISVCGTVRCC